MKSSIKKVKIKAVIRVFMFFVIFSATAGFSKAKTISYNTSAYKDEIKKLKADITKEIEELKKNSDENDKSDRIKDYNIDGAIPLSEFSDKENGEYFLVSHYKKSKDFSKLISQSGRWYIPCKKVNDAYAMISVYNESGKYKIAGIHYDQQPICGFETMGDLYKSVSDKIKDDKISAINIIPMEFFGLDTIYVKTEDNQEKIIPYIKYKMFGTKPLDIIGEKEGRVYSVSEFIKDLDNTYEEYTKEELEQVEKEVKEGGRIGGSFEPKLKENNESTDVGTDSNKGKISPSNIVILCVLAIVIIAGVLIAAKKKYAGF